MVRFFVVILILLGFIIGLTTAAAAIGVSDFVAVADGPTGGVSNPAGLAVLGKNVMSLEHRIDERDTTWSSSDDVMVYAATGKGGNGALFIDYNQDRIGQFLYERFTNLGYAYGWHNSKQMDLGMAVKLGYIGIFDDTSGTLTRMDSTQSLMFDFGMILKPSENWRFGLAVHNIGHSDRIDIDYNSNVGIAYHNERLTIAGEIDDLFATTFEESVIRGGLRFKVAKNLSFQIVGENSDYSEYDSQLIGIEFMTKNQVSINMAWCQVSSNFVDNDSIITSIGYQF